MLTVISISSVPVFVVISAIGCSGLKISICEGASMSFAVTTPAPFAFSVIVSGSSLCEAIRIRLRLSRSVITSSLIPSSVANSWSAPVIFTCVIAAPGSDERIIRRREFPSVCPYPGYSPSISNVP
jgi:hypothetical protein